MLFSTTQHKRQRCHWLQHKGLVIDYETQEKDGHEGACIQVLEFEREDCTVIIL